MDRLNAHEQVLRSAAAFFEHSDGVSRQEWQRFAAHQKLEQAMPGIQGLGVALLIPREKLAQHIQEVRAEGFPEYHVRPADEREVYSAITYLEPFAGRNLRAFGYDMLSEPVRRAAMERARDQNAATLSGKVRLVQETDQDVQTGTLMYVPVYCQEMPTETVDQRRAAIHGWVYSPYRMTDLMRGILGRADVEYLRRIHLRVFDGESATSAALLYDSQPAALLPVGAAARLTLQCRVVVAGRPWTLHYATLDSPTAAMVWFMWCSGTTISLLLGGFVLSLLNTRFKAEQIARQLTRELRVRAEHHRTILQTTRDGFWITDMQGQLLDANDAYSQMSGYSMPELLAMRVLDLEVGHASRDIAARIQAVTAKGEDRFESRHRRKDGSVFDVEISIQYQPADGGRLVAFVRDITERKTAETRLRESELRWQFAIEGSGDGLWDWDMPAGTVFFSSRWKEMLGHADDEVGNGLDEWRTRVHPEDLPGTLAGIKAHVDGRTATYASEHRVRCQDGSWKWILARGVVVSRDAAGNPLRMIGTHTDISERRQADETLRASEAKYRTLIETTGTGCVVLDWQGRVIDANAEYVRLSGHQELSEILGRCVDEWTAECEKRRNAEAVARCVRDGVVRNLVVDYVGAAGLVTPVEINGTLMGQGETSRIISVCRDITERKQAEAEHLKLEAQLRQAYKMEAIGRLAGGVAHDFNNMLQVILGNTELMLKVTAPGDPRHDDLKEVVATARRSSDLTRQLLAFARKQTIVPQVLDLNDTIASMLKMLRRLIGEDLELIWKPAANLGPVKMDPSQIDQILANLTVNARDAIVGVGTVTLVTDNVEIAAAYCETHPDATPGAYAVLAITDTGCGMDAETQAHIFEPFFTTKAVGQGTGMGLATVYGIVRQNNGFVEVYSAPGQGTTFKIYFPRHTATVAEVEVAPPPAAPVTGTETLLLVEDEATVLRLAHRRLVALGYNVLPANGPSAALRLAEEYNGNIHLLLTDVVMPGMSGRDLRERLSTARPEMKCLFMSGYTADIIAPHGVLDHGLHFIQKPFSGDALAAKLRAVLAEKR